MKKGVGVIVTAILLVACVIIAVFLPNKKYTGSFVAMGASVSVTSYGSDVSARVKKTVDEIERLISCKIEGTPVSRLNNGETVAFDKNVNELLELCERVCKDSDGAFDVAVLPLTSLWDFEKQIFPRKNDIENALTACGWGNVTKTGNSYKLACGGLDLGAVGKGFACDEAAKIINNGMISVGGSIGIFGKRPDNKKWSIGIRNPFLRNEIWGKLSLEDGFISTSGSYEKCFEINGEKYHHILDTKTGYPVKSELVSVTVVCSGGAMSDALSTACFAVGFERAKELCKKYSADAVFIFENGKTVASAGLQGFLEVFDGEADFYD